MGRPLGTTRKNGFKVAVDSNSYWEKRYSRERKIRVSNDKLKPYALYRVSKSTSNFMDKVVRGLEVFLSPPK